MILQMEADIQEERSQLQADFCRVFCNSKRVQILWALGDGEMSVGDLSIAVGTSIQNVSQHLRVMKSYQIVSNRREGKTIYYRADRQMLEAHCKGLICHFVENIENCNDR